ncbi:hypothetical protein D3C87_938200 [compost metagenome]
MHGHICAAAHGDTDVGSGEGRGVVDAVTDHGDHTGFFQLGDGRGFVRRQHFGVDIADTEGLGDHASAATVVAGQQMAVDILGGELLHGFQCTGFQGVTKGEQTEHFRFRALFD